MGEFLHYQYLKERWDRKRQGFTLVELVVVLIIIAVLAAIAYVAYAVLVKDSATKGLMTTAQSVDREATALAAFDSSAPADAVDAVLAEDWARDGITITEQESGGAYIFSKTGAEDVCYVPSTTTAQPGYVQPLSASGGACPAAAGAGDDGGDGGGGEVGEAAGFSYTGVIDPTFQSPAAYYSSGILIVGDGMFLGLDQNNPEGVLTGSVFDSNGTVVSSSSYDGHWEKLRVSGEESTFFMHTGTWSKRNLDFSVVADFTLPPDIPPGVVVNDPDEITLYELAGVGDGSGDFYAQYRSLFAKQVFVSRYSSDGGTLRYTVEVPAVDPSSPSIELPTAKPVVPLGGGKSLIVWYETYPNTYFLVFDDSTGAIVSGPHQMPMTNAADSMVASPDGNLVYGSSPTTTEHTIKKIDVNTGAVLASSTTSATVRQMVPLNEGGYAVLAEIRVGGFNPNTGELFVVDDNLQPVPSVPTIEFNYMSKLHASRNGTLLASGYFTSPSAYVVKLG